MKSFSKPSSLNLIPSSVLFVALPSSDGLLHLPVCWGYCSYLPSVLLTAVPHRTLGRDLAQGGSATEQKNYAPALHEQVRPV